MSTAREMAINSAQHDLCLLVDIKWCSLGAAHGVMPIAQGGFRKLGGCRRVLTTPTLTEVGMVEQKHCLRELIIALTIAFRAAYSWPALADPITVEDQLGAPSTFRFDLAQLPFPATWLTDADNPAIVLGASSDLYFDANKGCAWRKVSDVLQLIANPQGGPDDEGTSNNNGVSCVGNPRLVTGEFPLDASMLVMRMTKAGGGWRSAGTSLEGHPGDNLVSGRKWPPSSGNTTSSLGVGGNFHLDASEGKIWSKQSARWAQMMAAQSSGGGTPPSSEGPGATGRFVAWSDGKIYDPQGNVHVIRGIDIFPTQTSADDVNKIVNCWGFNTVMVTWPTNNTSFSQADVEAAIDLYLSHGLVVIVWDDDIGISGRDPPDMTDISAVIERFRPLARKYKNEPRVWWQPWSEILSRHTAMIYDAQGNASWNVDAINAVNNFNRAFHVMLRAEGNTAPFLMGVPLWGQDGKKDQNNLALFNEPVNELYATIKFHDLLFDGLDNVMIGPHPYQFKRAGTQADFNAYLDAQAALGVAVLLGDVTYWMVQASGNVPTFTPNLGRFTRNALENGRSVGATAWHWKVAPQENGGHALTEPTDPGTGNGRDINSCTNPTNLTEFGQVMWDLAHDGLLR